MPEIATIGLGAIAAYLGKDGIGKLLGPTCDYLGKEIQEWVEKRHNNVERIFDIACRRVGDELDEPGGVSPRILKEVLAEGSFVDDSLTAEYFGGLLACSRSDQADNDFYISTIKLIAQMSNIEIRTHYMLYLAVYRSLHAKSRSWQNIPPVYNLFYIDTNDFLVAADLKDQVSNNPVILNLCFSNLERNNLVSNAFWGKPEFLRTKYELLPKALPQNHAICFTPTYHGIELFMYANGLRKFSPNQIHEQIIDPVPNCKFILSNVAEYIDFYT